jgi:hypothetical protein
MKWRLPGIVAMVACGMWVAARGPSLAQGIVEKLVRFRQETQQQAEAHAARCAVRAVMREDNSACLVCHANLEQEEVAATHLKFGITCSHCHGLSYEHADDEGHMTKPDVTFGRAQVAPFCERCHGPHESPHKVSAFFEQWHGKTRPNGRELLDEAVCTDCHGTHTMKAVASD